jgi:hypothetical protein
MLRTVWCVRSHQVLELRIASSLSRLYACTGVRQSVDAKAKKGSGAIFESAAGSAESLFQQSLREHGAGRFTAAIGGDSS